jgi:hypothetical protein
MTYLRERGKGKVIASAKTIGITATATTSGSDI